MSPRTFWLAVIVTLLLVAYWTIVAQPARGGVLLVSSEVPHPPAAGGADATAYPTAPPAPPATAWRDIIAAVLTCLALGALLACLVKATRALIAVLRYWLGVGG